MAPAPVAHLAPALLARARALLARAPAPALAPAPAQAPARAAHLARAPPARALVPALLWLGHGFWLWLWLGVACAATNTDRVSWAGGSGVARCRSVDQWQASRGSDRGDRRRWYRGRRCHQPVRPSHRDGQGPGAGERQAASVHWAGMLHIDATFTTAYHAAAAPAQVAHQALAPALARVVPWPRLWLWCRLWLWRRLWRGLRGWRWVCWLGCRLR